MEPAVYREIAALEDTHWWFVGSRQILMDRLIPPGTPRGRVLDAGCGSGGALRQLASEGFGRTVGCDFSPLALAHCTTASRGRIAQADLTLLPFATAAFDLVTCADVLEHVEDDDAALAELRRVLVPGGRLGLAVPAFQCLWTEHDEANHHFRRYALGALLAKVRRAGFEVVEATYLNFLLGVPIALYRFLGHLAWRLRPRKGDLPDSDNKPLPNPVNRLCGWIYGLERKLIARVSLPFGTSILMILTNPGGR